MQRFDLNQNWEYLESSLQNPLMVVCCRAGKKQDLPHRLRRGKSTLTRGSDRAG